jgi:DNA-binding CsgD family transcriptional regulator/tetratricopeptide (TPR) repeat protein
VSAVVSPVGTVPFVGRRRELERFSAAMEDLSSGRGSVLVISGDAGIGKSRFLTEALAGITELRARVLRAAAQELDRLRPFGAIADCLQLDSTGARSLAELLSGEVGPGDALPMTLAFSPWRKENPPGLVAEASHLQFRILDGIRRLVEGLCSRSPLVVTVDDVQWVDVSSLLVLQRLAQDTARLPLVLVCAHRPQPRDAPLWGFLAAVPEERAHRLALGPLSDSEVTSLVAGVLEREPAQPLPRHVAMAEGNPFFILELLRSPAGSLHDDDHRPETGDGLPRSVTEAVRRRIGVLPRALQEVLQVASVLGSSFTASELSIVVGRPVSELVSILDDSVAAELLGQRGGALAFRHDFIREAFYRGLPDSVRRGLHLQAARALSSTQARAGLVAEHLVRGASPGDGVAVSMLHQAARAAGPRAPSISLQLLRRALEVADPTDPLRDRILADQVMILSWAGEAAEVERLSRALLDRVHDPSTEPLVRLCLAQSLLGRGRLLDALGELNAAIDSPALLATQRARFRAWASKCLMLLGRTPEAADVARLAIEEAERAGDTSARCLATAVLALMTNFAGDFRQAVELAEQAITIAHQDESGDAHRFPLHLYQAALLLDVDEPDEAKAAVVRGRRISEDLGTAWNLPMYHLISAVRLFWSGEWDDAIAEFEAGRELSDEIGGRIGMVAAFGLRSIIALHRGDLPLAEEMATEGERELATTGPQYRADWLLWARALVLEARGQVVAAHHVLSTAWEGCAAAGIVAEYPILGPDLVRLALATGNRQQAKLVSVEVSAARTAGIPSLEAVALRCQAMLSGGIEGYAAAAAAYRHSPRKLDQALAWEEAGAKLGERSAEEGRALLEDALNIYEALGASSDVARVDSRLRALGVRRGRRGGRKRPSSGWDALTRTELSVADLVCEGLSNPEIAERLFISPRTARTHVSHALLKLGFRSRAELAAEVVRRRS